MSTVPTSETTTTTQGDEVTARTPRVLLYSDDRTVREQVRLAVGRRLRAGGPDIEWLEVATPAAVVTAADAGGWDLLVLDGEADKAGGMGLCRQLKNEIYRCPPVLVLTGRPQDGWLASWSLADDAVPRPFDAMELQRSVRDLLGAAGTR
ncbi:response regulator transcription factor [Cellulosimicrobium terreum]|nr:response regulator transcription factor [Cellulosimicrobium terreum]